MKRVERKKKETSGNEKKRRTTKEQRKNVGCEEERKRQRGNPFLGSRRHPFGPHSLKHFQSTSTFLFWNVRHNNATTTSNFFMHQISVNIHINHPIYASPCARQLQQSFPHFETPTAEVSLVSHNDLRYFLLEQNKMVPVRPCEHRHSPTKNGPAH